MQAKSSFIFSFNASYMDLFYLGILLFLFVLAVFDLSVGVANDAVNFLAPAAGARAARFKTILIVAAVGIFVGASTSGGMMDIARHGIFTPAYYSFSDVMCIFLAVAAADIILLDIFNTLGMPTSTTVSMVFGLLGGSTALAMSKIVGGGFSYEQLINTDKALQVIIAIFLSVAIAFFFGLIVMWITRVVFTFNYKKHLRWSIALFGGISVTSIFYFLIVSGLSGSTILKDLGVSEWIDNNHGLLILCSLVVFTILTEILHLFRVNIFKLIVLFGTFSLAMAFAGNDLVNFIGTPLAGLESYLDFTANGATAGAKSYMMDRLGEPSTLPHMHIYLILAGLIMTIAIFRSKKAHKVVETTVNLSRQDEGEEVFSSSKIARQTVRGVLNTTSVLDGYIPKKVKDWIATRFNTEEAQLDEGVAFDLVRASVNLVLGGLLIVMGTALQLPLSTTYVAFMVAMGSSLADRAWGRETAVYRITGVITVIGGWFITAGAAFIMAFVIALLCHIGGFVAMLLLIVLLVVVLVNNNRKFKRKQQEDTVDTLFRRLVRCHDKAQTWDMLVEHVSRTQSELLEIAKNTLSQIGAGLMDEDIRTLRLAGHAIEDEKNKFKRYRRKEIIGMRKIDQMQAVEKNTWFHLGCNNCTQIIYCLKRMFEPVMEHVDNNFAPIPEEYKKEFRPILSQVEQLISDCRAMIEKGDFTNVDKLLVEGNALKANLSQERQCQQDRLQREDGDIKSALLYLNTLQEMQEIVSMTRHLLRAAKRFRA